MLAAGVIIPNIRLTNPSMSEGSRGGISYWSKYRSIKRSVRRQVEDLQEDSDKLAQEKNFPENTENPRYTCTEKIYMSQFNLNINTTRRM